VRQQIELGYKTNEVDPVILWQERRSRVLLGMGRSRCSRGRAEVAAVVRPGGVHGPGHVSQLSPDRLVVIGSGSCQKGSRTTSTSCWSTAAQDGFSGNTRPRDQWFDEPGGTGPRRRVSGQGKREDQGPPASCRSARLCPDGYHPAASADAERLLIIGERMEVLSLADGAVLWRSPRTLTAWKTVRALRVPARCDKLSAIKPGPASPLDDGSRSRRTTLYSADDLLGIGEPSPLGP